MIYGCKILKQDEIIKIINNEANLLIFQYLKQDLKASRPQSKNPMLKGYKTIDSPLKR